MRSIPYSVLPFFADHGQSGFSASTATAALGLPGGLGGAPAHLGPWRKSLRRLHTPIPCTDAPMSQRTEKAQQQRQRQHVQLEEVDEEEQVEEGEKGGVHGLSRSQWPHLSVCQGRQAAIQRDDGGSGGFCRGGGNSITAREGSSGDRCGHGGGGGTASGHGDFGESGVRLDADSGPDSGGADDEPVAVGYVLVSVSQPLALLPPPLPSTSPLQFHVDALAVCARYRRQGVGSRLLAEAERLVMRWGGNSLWLHVDASNDAAVQMYSDRGYGIARILRPRLAPGSLLGGPTIGWRPPFLLPFLPHYLDC
ncbi:hypothetical protein VaNZ11_016518 [Volvox africanus]|uniref:N-acetyltransferase domain-containing protein n=1 Tax=Volvox africanus TaxID=51714 RepID=A0ABQ5SN39_9CHLO|nr:hypothetical protein VaNZ11_016518 [Volvox africanus]